MRALTDDALEDYVKAHVTLMMKTEEYEKEKERVFQYLAKMRLELNRLEVECNMAEKALGEARRKERQANS